LPVLPGAESRDDRFDEKIKNLLPYEGLRDNPFTGEMVLSPPKKGRRFLSYYLSMTGIGVSSLSSKWFK
jgi:hypothetical protein